MPWRVRPVRACGCCCWPVRPGSGGRWCGTGWTASWTSVPRPSGWRRWARKHRPGGTSPSRRATGSPPPWRSVGWLVRRCRAALIAVFGAGARGTWPRWWRWTRRSAGRPYRRIRTSCRPTCCAASTPTGRRCTPGSRTGWPLYVATMAGRRTWPPSPVRSATTTGAVCWPRYRSSYDGRSANQILDEHGLLLPLPRPVIPFEPLHLRPVAGEDFLGPGAIPGHRHQTASPTAGQSPSPSCC